MGSRRRLVAAVAVVALVWLGARWWRGDSDSGSEGAKPNAHRAPIARRYQNGQWVSDDGKGLWDALRKVRYRPAGLWRVSGTVREYQTLAPIPGAEMVLAGPMGENSAVADGEGRYTMLVQPGSYRAFARADGYIAVGEMPIERVPSQPDASKIGLPEGHIAPALFVGRDHVGIDVHLTGAAQIYGTVYDGDGYPVPEVLVVAERASRGASGVARPVLGSHIDETDYDGSYRLTVPAGFLKIAANHIDYAGVEYNTTRVLGPGEEARVDLTLTRGCIIKGTVVDADGYRVDEGSLERWVGGAPPNDYAPATRIDGDGDFRLALTTTGEVKLRAWPWKSGPSHPQTFDCRDGALYEGVVLVAQDLDADLEGTVIDADGDPIEHVFVDILPMDRGGMEQQERANRYGEFAVFQLPQGDYRVQAYVPGKGIAMEIVTTPTRGIRLQLGGTGSIAGKVLGIDNGAFTMTVRTCAITDVDGEVDGNVLGTFDDVTMPDIQMVVPVTAGEFRIDGLPTCAISGRASWGARSTYFRATVPAGGIGQVGEIDLRAPGDRIQIDGNRPPPRW